MPDDKVHVARRAVDAAGIFAFRGMQSCRQVYLDRAEGLTAAGLSG